MVLAGARIYNGGVGVVMNSLLTFRKMGNENVLKPITLSGVIVPWSKLVSPKRKSDYKLVCANGVEYFILANDEWQDILSWYSWEDVKVIGLLNTSNLTLIPQRVFPKGPKGEKENVIDLALGKGRHAIKKFTKNVKDLVLVPATA